MYANIHEYININYMDTHLAFCNHYIVFSTDKLRFVYQNDISLTAPDYSLFATLADMQDIPNKFNLEGREGLYVACFDFNSYSVVGGKGVFVLHGIFNVKGGIKLLDMDSSYDIVGGWEDIELAWYKYPKHEVFLPTVGV